MRFLIKRSDVQIRNISIFLLHNIGNLVETVTALLVASVSKICNVRWVSSEQMCERDISNLNIFFSKCIFYLFRIILFCLFRALFCVFFAFVCEAQLCLCFHICIASGAKLSFDSVSKVNIEKVFTQLNCLFASEISLSNI